MIKNKTHLSIMIIVLLALFVSPTFAQTTKDSADGRFHDDLLDHLVGNWKVASVAHNFSSTGNINATWVLNHQYIYFHFIGNDTIPWWHMPMEFEVFIGYNHNNKRYTVHGMSIEGDADLSEGFSYGYRNGNEFKIVAKFSADTSIVQRFIWEPISMSWNIQSKMEISGKEGEVFLDMKLVR